MKRAGLVLLFLALSGAVVLPAMAEDDPQATIEALQTQVAVLSGTVSTPESVPDISATERSYLETVASGVESFRMAREGVDFYREYPPSFADPTMYRLSLMMALLPLYSVRETMVPAAPSERLSPFNADWNAAVQAYLDAADLLQGEDDVSMTAAGFSQALGAFDQASSLVDDALDELRTIGLYDVMNEFISPPPAPGTHTVHGTILLTDRDANWHLSYCVGDGGFSDLAPGAQVSVRDESNTILAIGAITESVTQSPIKCELRFVVRDIPTASFYQFQVSGRGAPMYSHAEMEMRNWLVELAIGD